MLLLEGLKMLIGKRSDWNKYGIFMQLTPIQGEKYVCPPAEVSVQQSSVFILHLFTAVACVISKQSF